MDLIVFGHKQVFLNVTLLFNTLVLGGVTSMYCQADVAHDWMGPVLSCSGKSEYEEVISPERAMEE